MGDVPFYLKFALKNDPPPLKHTDLDQYLLITSQPYKLAKNVQLTQIGNRPRKFERGIDGEVRTLPLIPRNGG